MRGHSAVGSHSSVGGYSSEGGHTCMRGHFSGRGRLCARPHFYARPFLCLRTYLRAVIPLCEVTPLCEVIPLCEADRNHTDALHYHNCYSKALGPNFVSDSIFFIFISSAAIIQCCKTTPTAMQDGGNALIAINCP